MSDADKSLGRSREEIEDVIAMVQLAYEDCAEWCDHLASNSNAGLSSMDENSRMLAGVILRQLAASIRSKASAARRAMMDYAGEPLQ